MYPANPNIVILTHETLTYAELCLALTAANQLAPLAAPGFPGKIAFYSTANEPVDTTHWA